MYLAARRAAKAVVVVQPHALHPQQLRHNRLTERETGMEREGLDQGYEQQRTWPQRLPQPQPQPQPQQPQHAAAARQQRTPMRGLSTSCRTMGSTAHIICRL